MSTRSRAVVRASWRLVLSAILFWGTVELGRSLSERALPGQDPSLDLREGGTTGAGAKGIDAWPQDPPSARPSAAPFSMPGIPMGFDSHPLAPCDPGTWSPQKLEAWTPGSQLLDLTRGETGVRAAWVEWPSHSAVDGGVGGVFGSHPETHPTPGFPIYHSAQLHCSGTEHGEVHHTWVRPADPEETRATPAVGSEAIPRLPDAVRRLGFRSLGWWIAVDELTETATALERLEVRMAADGWHRQELAGPLNGRPMAPWQLPPGGQGGPTLILRRGPARCLARVVELGVGAPGSGQSGEDKSLLTACLGLAVTRAAGQGTVLEVPGLELHQPSLGDFR